MPLKSKLRGFFPGKPIVSGTRQWCSRVCWGTAQVYLKFLGRKSVRGPLIGGVENFPISQSDERLLPTRWRSADVIFLIAVGGFPIEEKKISSLSAKMGELPPGAVVFWTV
jgi:hypothetical protein